MFSRQHENTKKTPNLREQRCKKKKKERIKTKLLEVSSMQNMWGRKIVSKEAVPRGNSVLSPFVTMWLGKRLIYFPGWGQLHYLLSPSQRLAVEIPMCLTERRQRNTTQQGGKVAYMLLDWVNTSQGCTTLCEKEMQELQGEEDFSQD